ncbi:SLC13 family permease [Longitalea arenae]|uniref:SLC13 family permease n=1 Tax=Longitalea arenae TaxID=2812558 RepID=UPI0019680330|nr:DASS family sodium-coupled anion symporter [Longitalea arenae]
MTKQLRNQLALGAGLILFLILFFVNPFHFDTKAARVLAVAVLMITWWVSEALPMPVVALIPLVLFPLLNIMPIKEVSAGYADSNIFLFMGGFMIGLAIEKWNLHKRIALTIVNITGTSGNRIVLGFILATGLLSMWLSNTATTMMMYPIAASVIAVIKENHKGNARLDNLAICIMLAIAYASNFGGIATIVGTPPNVAFVSFIKEKYNYAVQFADWMLICTPLSLLLLFSLYFLMTKWLYPSRLGSDGATKELIKYELQQLGPLTASEKRVLTIFVSTALLWITKDLINRLNVVKLDDTMIAMAGALALFICPAGDGSKEGSRRKILEWADTSKMAWGILLLFGGGIALAGALEKAGLIKQLGQWIAGFSGSGGLMLVFVIALVSLFVSEVMSNIAQVIVFSPVIGGIADAMQINPILLGLPMCLGASCASMMPMGTPPNAIVFASGHIKFNQMVKAGFVMNVIAVILITLFCWYLVPFLMNL